MLTAEESEVSLPDIFRMLVRRRRMIALSTCIAAAATTAIAFLLPVRFAAEAVIMPPQPEQSTQAMMMSGLAGLSGLGVLGGAGASSLFRNPGDLYAGLLKSRGVADAIIARFDLRRLYREKTMVDTRRHLARRVEIAISKDLLIHIRVEDGDCERAAAMANAYVEELHRQNSRLALTSSGQRRLFFDEQLRNEKQALADAESALKREQQSSGLIYPAGQSEVLLRSIAQVRAEIASREVEAQSMRLYAATRNPQMQQLEEETAALRAQLRKMEGSDAGAGVLVPAARIPEAGLEYVRAMREMKYHEALFELLARQYEAARIDEARESPVVQVVDPAIPSDKKSWPPRMLLVSVAAVLAALVSSLIAIWPRAGARIL